VSEPAPPPPRSVKRAVASIVLSLEAFVVFFATLVFFGLEYASAGVVFAVGGALFLLLILTAGLLRYRAGYWLGWALQGVLVASGFIEPTMFVVGGIFAAMWVFGLVRGSSVDELNLASYNAAMKERT
jgi:hypothetical protein